MTTPNREVVVAEPHTPALVELGTLQADTARELVTSATQIADTLAAIIAQKHLSQKIQGRDYVRVEGWTVLGALLGVVAREESVVEREDGSYVATIALVRMKDDVVVSRASAECSMDEATWAARPKYARRSMALTRATGKAARLAFSWIMTLAGYEPTPAEEMPVEHEAPRRQAAPARAARSFANEDGTPVGDEFVQHGKHRGKRWEEVGSDYLSAIVNGDKGSPEFKSACQREIDRRAELVAGGAGPMEAEIPF